MGNTRYLWVPLIIIIAVSANVKNSTPVVAWESKSADRQIDFQQDVAPLLRAKCIECHGPATQMADLRLDEERHAFEGGESGEPIEAGDSDASLLVERLHNKELGLVMPPTGKLSDDEIAIFRRWIDQGAEWPDGIKLAPVEDAKEENPKYKSLFSAIRRADTQAVKRALDEDAELANLEDRYGSTPLMYAALYAECDCVQLLLDRGADPNHVDEHGATALMWGARDEAKSRLLVAHKANVNARSKFGRTPLMVASTFAGNVGTVQLLLAAGADFSATDEQKDSALTLAVMTGDVELVEVLLKAGADVNQGPASGKPLSGAAYLDHLPMMQLLLGYGARGSVNDGGLVYAAANGSVLAVTMLLDAGARVNDQVKTGSLPEHALSAAAYSDYQSKEVVRSLLAHGADPTVRDSHDQTAFQYATRRTHTELVDLMTRRQTNQQQSVRGAAAKTLALLQSCGETFYRQSGCVACHHHTVTSLAIHEARRTGAEYDEEAAKKQLKMAALVKAQRRPRFLQRIVTGGAGHTTGYLLWGMAAEGYSADEITDAAAIELSGLQMADGSWFSHAHRPPTEYSRISATAVSVRGMQLFAPPGLVDDFQPQYERARQWLVESKPNSNQEYAFRLLGLKWTEASRSDIERAARALLHEQQVDGGWSQLPGMDTDAYATGLALYALHVGGGLPTSDPAYRRGVQFLLDRQLADGSWHVRSRSYKFQPYFESGFPHHHDQWISAAATGWSATALMLSLETQGTHAGG
jgi:ankyrin repeat protein